MTESFNIEVIKQELTEDEVRVKEEIKIRAKALGKDSIVLLLNLISSHKVITSKVTNATNNKLKEEAWKSIAQELSALTGEMRRPDQLRLKWENLKKAARKRSAFIRQNNLKTGGGKAFIPPDEVLDNVASMLGATCAGFSVVFGGDGAFEAAASEVPIQDAIVDVPDLEPLPEPPQNSCVVVEAGGGGLEAGGDGLEAGSGTTCTSKKFVFSNSKTLNKRRKLSEEVQRAQRDKDLALADYFQAKKEKVILESRKLQLENKKLELENKKLELECLKIESEIGQQK